MGKQRSSTPPNRAWKTEVSTPEKLAKATDGQISGKHLNEHHPACNDSKKQHRDTVRYLRHLGHGASLSDALDAELFSSQASQSTQHAAVMDPGTASQKSTGGVSGEDAVMKGEKVEEEGSSDAAVVKPDGACDDTLACATVSLDSAMANFAFTAVMQEHVAFIGAWPPHTHKSYILDVVQAFEAHTKSEEALCDLWCREFSRGARAKFMTTPFLWHFINNIPLRMKYCENPDPDDGLAPTKCNLFVTKSTPQWGRVKRKNMKHIGNACNARFSAPDDQVYIDMVSRTVHIARKALAEVRVGIPFVQTSNIEAIWRRLHKTSRPSASKPTGDESL